MLNKQRTFKVLALISIYFYCTAVLFSQEEQAIKLPTEKSEGGFKSAGKYKRYQEVVFGLGGANFLGDIGGADQVGTFFMRDLNISATRPSSQISLRIKFKDHWALKTGFYFNTIAGADSLTLEIYRHNRNISFRTRIVELSSQIEYYFKKEKPTKNYKIKGEEGKLFSKANILSYVFMGVGVCYFNPKAQYKNHWYPLHKMSTEGQGLPGGRSSYSRITVVIPFGMGFKVAINKKMYMGFEYGGRKTYSDYLDDVSDTYYDNNVIRQQRGATAAYFADPKIWLIPLELDPDRFYKYGYKKADQAAPGEQRGNIRNKDFYMFLNITLSYKINSIIEQKRKKQDTSIRFN